MRTSVARAFAAAVFAIVATGCSNTLSTPPVPQQSTTPVPQISVHVTGQLKYVGDNASVTAKQTSYTGPFTYTSSNRAVLALYLTTTGPASTPRRAGSSGGKQTLVSPDGTAFVIVTGPGTATITIAGGDGAVAAPASLHVANVPATGALVVSPPALNFTAIGAGNAQNVVVAQGAYAGPFLAIDSCPKIAKLSVSSNANGEAHYTFTPIAAGTCNAVFTGGQGKSVTLPVSVALPPGTVKAAPANVTFTSVLASDSGKVAVSQANFAGAFTESDTCAKIATLAATSNDSGNASYTVKPAGAGTCTAKFSGGGGKSASVSIDVTPPAPVVAVVCAQSVDACTGGTATAPGTVQFTAVGNTATVTPSDPKWTNAPNFTLKSDTCNKTDDPSAGGNWATLAPAVGKSAASFAVTAAGAGTTSNKANCVATFVDVAGRTVKVNVEITLGSIGVSGRKNGAKI